MGNENLEKNMLDLVLKGVFEIVNFKDIKFKLTPFGKEEAETLIKVDPKMKAFWNQLKLNKLRGKL